MNDVMLDREVLRSVLLDVEGAEQRRFKVLDQLDALDRFGRIRDQSALGEFGSARRLQFGEPLEARLHI